MSHLHCTDTGGGGWIDKNKCQASCNSNATRDSKEYLGYIGALVAVLCFGSNFVPVKQYETGDGERGWGVVVGGERGVAGVVRG